ncbi:glutamate-cysteine ligase family protein [Geodermatophilus sp. SYSU D00814]
MRTVGVEEELLVVDPAGTPVPLGPEALEVASRRGEGETPEEHERGSDAGTGTEGSAGHLVPELKRQQLELGTAVCTGLAQVDRELRSWRGRADAAARAVGARVAALASSPVAVTPEPTPGRRYGRMEGPSACSRATS